MLQLHSFSRALLVFLTGPLGIAGAAMALLLLQRPFDFVAQLGVIALFGMIIRNSVILIDQIEQDIVAGAAPWNAIIESAVRRCSHHGRLEHRNGVSSVILAGLVCSLVPRKKTWLT